MQTQGITGDGGRGRTSTHGIQHRQGGGAGCRRSTACWILISVVEACYGAVYVTDEYTLLWNYSVWLMILLSCMYPQHSARALAHPQLETHFADAVVQDNCGRGVYNAGLYLLLSKTTVDVLSWCVEGAAVRADKTRPIKNMKSRDRM